MKNFYLLVILILTATAASAQYDKSAGIRLGHSSGVTFKKFVHAEEAVEILLGGRNKGLQLTTTYQFHKPMKWGFTDRIYFNYGIGGHFGYEKTREEVVLVGPVDQLQLEQRRRSEFTMGIDGVVGLEYRWLVVPMTVGLDLKPYFDFVGMRTTNLRFWDFAVSFKYIF